MPTQNELDMLRALPLDLKILKSKQRIREWVYEYGKDNVYISFSGGKDSTVLANLIRQEFPTIPLVFVDTGLEYPEIKEFVKTFDNVTTLRPKLTFLQVIEKYGFPVISKEVSEMIGINQAARTTCVKPSGNASVLLSTASGIHGGAFVVTCNFGQNSWSPLTSGVRATLLSEGFNMGLY
jgi:hypothetical protein